MRCRMPWPHLGKPRLRAAYSLGSWKLFQGGGPVAAMCCVWVWIQTAHHAVARTCLWSFQKPCQSCINDLWSDKTRVVLGPSHVSRWNSRGRASILVESAAYPGSRWKAWQAGDSPAEEDASEPCSVYCWALYLAALETLDGVLNLNGVG